MLNLFYTIQFRNVNNMDHKEILAVIIAIAFVIVVCSKTNCSQPQRVIMSKANLLL